MRRMALMIAVVALAGCGSSPPTRFFTLDPVAPETRSPLRIGTPVKIDAVHIPPALDRQSIVRGESGNRLDITSRDRWGAAFGEMALRVLTQDLESRLPRGAVIASDMPAPGNARGVVVEILSFEPNGSGQLRLDADWTLLQGSPANPVLRRTVHLTASAGSSAASQAAGMSRLLGELADRIAAGVSETAPPSRR